MGEEFLDMSWGDCVVLPSMSFRMACLRKKERKKERVGEEDGMSQHKEL